MKLMLGKKKSRESLERSRVPQFEKSNKQRQTDLLPAKSQVGPKNNKLIDAPFHHNKVIDPHQKSNRKLELNNQSGKRPVEKIHVERRDQPRVSFKDEF